MKNKTTIKIIGETYLIPLCIIYLLFKLLNNHVKASLIICFIMILITSLEFMIKYFKEVYIYENKYNFLKLSFAIFNLLFIIISGLNLFYKFYIIKLLFVIGTIILLLFLISFSISSIIKYAKDTKKTSYIIKSFLSFLSFCIILLTFLIHIF